jgi:hypothetical protein
MTEYTFRGYIIGPQEYEPAYDKDGNQKKNNRKLSPNKESVTIKASGATEAAAKKIAAKDIKNSKQYERFKSNIGSDAPTNPRVQIEEKSKHDAKFKAKIKAAGAGSIMLGPDLVRPDDKKYFGTTDNRGYRDIKTRGS